MLTIDTPPDHGSIKDKLLWVANLSPAGTKNFKKAVGYLSVILSNAQIATPYADEAHKLYHRVRSDDEHRKMRQALQPRTTLSVVDDQEPACKLLTFPKPE